VVWLLAAVAGLGALASYAATAGPEGSPARSWPGDSRVSRSTQVPTLVLFAHPRCACTRATLGELAILMTHVQGRVAAHVIFFRPSDGGPEWVETDLWKQARAIPGVSVEPDRDGREAAAFGAIVSGAARLYDREGTLIFDGGMTASRGHSGDNDGRSALQLLLTGSPSPVTHTSVFGCLIGQQPVL